MIDEVRADVWVITESHPHLDLGPDFRMLAESVPAPDRSPGERWVAIWVRSTADACALPGYASERTACVRLAGPADLLVYGTVLPWGNDDRFGPRGFEAFATALDLQVAHWRDLRKIAPLVVAGDLNQDLLPEGRHYYGSKEKRDRLRTKLDEVGLRCVTADLEVDGHACIDHICLSPEVRPEYPACEVWPKQRDTSLSDHFAVAVRVEAG
jgi:hypothetical protein